VNEKVKVKSSKGRSFAKKLLSAVTVCAPAGEATPQLAQLRFAQCEKGEKGNDLDMYSPIPPDLPSRPKYTLCDCIIDKPKAMGYKKQK